MYSLILSKNVLGYILGDFFHILIGSPCHPYRSFSTESNLILIFKTIIIIPEIPFIPNQKGEKVNPCGRQLHVLHLLGMASMCFYRFGMVLVRRQYGVFIVLVCFFNIVFVWHQCGVLIFG
jgi:hypothetical protein